MANNDLNKINRNMIDPTLVQEVEQTSNKIGNLSELKTTNKTDIVKSVNEVTAQLAEKAKQTDIDSLNNTLLQKPNKSEVRESTSVRPINVSEMDTATKQLFTGGSVAVVGERAVGTENVKPLAITPETTSFAKRGKNKFDGLFYNATMTGSTTFTFAVSATGKSAIVKVKPNTTYTISKTQDTDRFRVGAFVDYPIAGAKTTNLTQSDSATSRTITTSTVENYLVIYVSSDVQGLTPKQLQVEEGAIATTYVLPNTKLVIDLDESSIPNISPEKTTFVKKGRNLFNGEYDSRYIATVSGSFISNSTSRTSKKLEVKPNTFYTVSGGDRSVFRFVDANDIFITHFNAPSAQSPSNAKYMYVYYSSDGSHKEVQIEEGSLATGYTPYDAVVIKLDRASLPGNQDLPDNIISITQDFIITDDIRGNYVNTTSGYYVGSGFKNNVNNVYAIYDALVELYPDYVTKTLLGNEVTGLPIYRYDFKPPVPKDLSDVNPPKMLYVSGIHAHEKSVIGMVAMFFEDLAKNWKTNEVLRMLRWNVHFIVVPCLNPYGFNHDQRKNGNQVDLSRNFPNGWKNNTTIESQNYQGASPLSEIESQIMDRLLEENKDIAFAVDFHNYTFYPSSSSHLFWWDSLNKNTRKMLIGVANYMSIKAKIGFPQQIEQGNNSVTAVIRQGLSGMHYQFFEYKGISGAIVEAVTGFTGGTNENMQRLGAEMVGNLTLSAVRNINEIQ